VRDRRPVPEYHTLRESARGALNRLYLRSKDRDQFLATPSRHVITVDAYYGREAPPELFARLGEKLGRCLTNLLDQPLWDDLAALAPGDLRVIDEVDTVVVDGVTVYVAPDLVFRTRRDGWVVLDWKSGAADDAEAQLALYALYLRDGLGLPARGGGYRGLVVHLETGRTQAVDITPDDLELARARVADGVHRMHAFLADVEANAAHPAHAFALAPDQRACRFCNYRELCAPELAQLPPARKPRTAFTLPDDDTWS
jgi:CRISPR/Cas system-associated exonuclease Cas4 (RecB family)